MKKSWVCLQILTCALCVHAQEPHFYNSNQSLLNLNPSFAGSNGFIRNQLSYRNQWPSISGTMVWYNNSFDAFVRAVNAGIGLSVSSENQGFSTYNNRSLGLTYAQHILLGGGKIRIVPSLEWRYCVSSLDVSVLHFGDPVNVRTGEMWTSQSAIPVPTRRYGDVSAGLLIHFENIYLGGSMAHMNRPHLGHSDLNYRMPATINLHASTNYDLADHCLLQGLVRYRNFAGLSAANAQVNAILFRYLMLGAGWWTTDDFTANAGFRGKGFTLGIGYDMTVSWLAGNPVASWEIHASLNLHANEAGKDLAPFEEF
jgi:type IX secretion system PorP/SprF family membrane protein